MIKLKLFLRDRKKVRGFLIWAPPMDYKALASENSLSRALERIWTELIRACGCVSS